VDVAPWFGTTSTATGRDVPRLDAVSPRPPDEATGSAPPSRRRLTADERRREIVLHAAAVFAALGPDRATTADVAQAAGVTRALVHHHIGGIAEVYEAVVWHSAAACAPAARPAPDAPLPERVAADLRQRMDAVAAHADLWLTTTGNPFPPNETRVRRALGGVEAAIVAETLALYADVLDDTPATRTALHAYLRLATDLVRAWLQGRTERAFAADVAQRTFLHLVDDLRA
jgi:AcrR family transcriptional regulator